MSTHQGATATIEPGAQDAVIAFPGDPLERGAHGQPVRTIQNSVRVLGNPELAGDGVFGPATERLIRVFQRNTAPFRSQVSSTSNH